MVKVTGKRVCAYILDIIVVYFIVSLFTRIEFLNPHIEEYKIVSERYNELYDDYLDAFKNNSSELEKMDEELVSLQYDVYKTSVSNTIINILVTIIYFIVFQYFNKGQTIGKRLMKVKLVDSESKNKPSIMQIASRALIVNSIFTSVLTVLLVTYGTKEMYSDYGSYVVILDSALLFGTLGVMLFRKDGKGFHDLFAGTNVISTVEVNENKEYTNEKIESNVKEASYTEKKSKTNAKNKTNTKTKSKSKKKGE